VCFVRRGFACHSRHSDYEKDYTCFECVSSIEITEYKRVVSFERHSAFSAPEDEDELLAQIGLKECIVCDQLIGSIDYACECDASKLYRSSVLESLQSVDYDDDADAESTGSVEAGVDGLQVNDAEPADADAVDSDGSETDPEGVWE